MMVDGDPVLIRALLRSAAGPEPAAGSEPVGRAIALMVGYVGDGGVGRYDRHPLLEIFEVDPTGIAGHEQVPIPLLDTAIRRCAPHLTTDQLLALLGVSFARLRDNFTVTVIAVEELVRRADVAGQQALIDLFDRARYYYDAGHREDARSVYDVLIDELLPGFQPVVLARLLLRLPEDYLAADRFYDLFAPAFAGPLPTELESELLERFRAVVAGTDDHRLPEWVGVVEDLHRRRLPAPVGPTVAELLAVLAARSTASARARTDTQVPHGPTGTTTRVVAGVRWLVGWIGTDRRRQGR